MAINTLVNSEDSDLAEKFASSRAAFAAVAATALTKVVTNPKALEPSHYFVAATDDRLQTVAATTENGCGGSPLQADNAVPPCLASASTVGPARLQSLSTLTTSGGGVVPSLASVGVRAKPAVKARRKLANGSSGTSAPSPPGNSQTVNSRGSKHVMLSYQWDHQLEVVRVREALSAYGIRCWMDIDEMGTDIYDSMAEGVQGAACVLCFMSDAYQDSANCKLECKFARQSGIPIVVVKVQEGFKASKWLGIITVRYWERQLNPLLCEWRIRRSFNIRWLTC